MVDLKCTEILYLELGYAELDCSSRQYKDEPRYFYLGMASQLVQFKEDDMDKVIQLLNDVKKLKLTKKSQGWLK